MARAVQVLTPAELEEKWERFIRHCGGKMPVTETREIGDEKQPQSGSPQATLTSAYAERLERLREKYPNAYRPWSAELDATLTQFFQAEMGLAEIGQEMGRRRGSIRARLIKLGLIDRQGQRLGQREG
jgi:hypothetical protein